MFQIIKTVYQDAIDKYHSEGLIPLLQSAPTYVLRNLYKKRFEFQHGNGIDVMEQDWDNLILLDSYRYDFFEKYNSFEGDLSRVVSKANSSREFIEKNFQGRDLHDTVYVTANTYFHILEQDDFYTVEHLFDRWNSELGTVHPKEVTRAAIEAQRKYPNKRLIIHYMQPHSPHLGEIGQKYEDYSIGVYRDVEGVDQERGTHLFELYESGHVSRKELMNSYIQNIEIVEPHVKQLLNNLAGKSVISADHGENLGENHYGETLTAHNNVSKECRFVPWMEIPHQERKSVIADDPIGFDTLTDDVVEDRLRDLGYL